MTKSDTFSFLKVSDANKEKGKKKQLYPKTP